MAHQGEPSKDNIRLASQDITSKDDLRFDLNEIQLSQAKSNETDGAPSTLYDPAVLALSPEYRAKVEQRQTRQPFQEDEKVPQEAPFHIASPARRTVQLPIGEATIRLPEESEAADEEESTERELCCHGLLPLFPSMIVFNVMNIIIGITCIGIGASQLSRGNKDVVGFGSAGRLVITGSYLMAIFSTLLGSLFIVCGFLGVTANYAKANASSKSRKIPDLVYHCILFLVTIICIIIFGLNVYAITVRRSGPVYDTELWKEFVRSDSRHLCNVEQRLNCAAVSLGQCRSENNETRHTFCPGHFCVDFCRIATDDVSLHPICAACRQDPLSSIPTFVACKSLERERSAQQTCDGLPDEDLGNAYRNLLRVAMISFVWIFVVWAVIAYVECFL